MNVKQSIDGSQYDEVMARAITPKGYSLLVKVLDVKTSHTYHGMEIDYETGMTKGAVPLVIPREVLEKEQRAESTGQIYARVLKCGRDAYTRMHFTPEEVWTKPGDLVRMAQYGGEMVKTPNGLLTSLRFINDADVLATVDEAVLQEAGLLQSTTIEIG